MKKIISLVLAVLCAISLVACGGGKSTNVLSKIKPSGEKVSIDQAGNYIIERQNAYLESDTAKLESLTEQWYKIDVKIVEESESEGTTREYNTKQSFKFSGVMGVTKSGRINMKLEFEVVSEGESKWNSHEEVAVMSQSVKGKIIAVDGVAYIEAKMTEEVDGEKSTEEIKVMQPVEDMDFDGFDDLVSEGFYGTEIFGALIEALGIDFSGEPIFYLDGDKVYAELKLEDADEYEAADAIFQFEVVYAEKSAIVNSVRFYGEVNAEGSDGMGGYSAENQVKLGLSISECEPQTVKAPNDDDYMWA
ncbi:MAG: hypothetical protein IJA76_00515 [Clostridia bacterium]|nr:hypothetical protein [Clostridia bacterium]MBQ6882721.1 hypothetical protein [Clostridia bacterium]